MESHRLILEEGPRDAGWLLQWDREILTLTAPDGQRVLEVPPTTAVRIVEWYDLYAEGKICFFSPQGPLLFEKQTTAAVALRRLVEAELAENAEFRSVMRRRSLWATLRGLAMFVVGGGLFGTYCWYASWAPEPPPWIHWVGWLIHGVLLVLMGIGVLGAYIVYFGIRQWLGVRHLERLAAKDQSHG